jgi:cell surface protein SprA
MFALDYDSDRHFSYPSILETDTISLVNYPFIDSRVQITRLEIWVTNKQNSSSDE